jgi:hypothetical protein
MGEGSSVYETRNLLGLVSFSLKIDFLGNDYSMATTMQVCIACFSSSLVNSSVTTGPHRASLKAILALSNKF